MCNTVYSIEYNFCNTKKSKMKALKNFTAALDTNLRDNLLN